MFEKKKIVFGFIVVYISIGTEVRKMKGFKFFVPKRRLLAIDVIYYVGMYRCQKHELSRFAFVFVYTVNRTLGFIVR